MDSELDQVLCTVLSLEEDYPTLSPTMIEQDTLPNAVLSPPGLFSSMETQQDLQTSPTLKKTLLEIYNLLGIQRQAQLWKSRDPKTIQRTSSSSPPSSSSSTSSTMDNVSNEGSPATSKRKFHEKENEVYKKVRIEKEELTTTTANARCRKRTNYSKEQIAHLMREFNRNPYPDFANRSRISQITGISEPRIQVWFQNRRARHLLKPSKSEEDSQQEKFPTTDQTGQGYRENPPDPQLYGAADTPETTWMLPDLLPLLY
ncbi:homeobox protein siamois-like [Dendropsophus ebraccatus]|uniref:homeobox protein siamois-like n=1 Tax=Dendropsophus ebraccatus TaxID=150705 RepID=UPI003831B2CB